MISPLPLCAGCGREITDASEQASLCAQCEAKIQAGDTAWLPNAASKAASITMEARND